MACFVNTQQPGGGQSFLFFYFTLDTILSAFPAQPNGHSFAVVF